VRDVKGEPHATKYIKCLEDTLLGGEELHRSLSALSRVRTNPVELIGIREASDQLIGISLLYFLNIDTERWNVLLPRRYGDTVRAAMGDRTHDPYWPEGLTLLAAKHRRHDRKANSGEAFTSGRATENKVLLTLKGYRVSESLLLKWMKLKVLNILFRYEGERNRWIGKWRDYLVGMSVIRRFARR
jgi:hypothetical protein